MTRTFSITYDYLCPFARNANEAVITGLRAGRDWDVEFVPFSLSQTKVGEGEEAVWEGDPEGERRSGVRALEWSVAVRDLAAERFLDYHLASFSARHDHGRDINDERVLASVAAEVGIDPAEIEEKVASGAPAKMLGEDHGEAVRCWQVFGVPTVIAGAEAVFVRMMERGRADDLDRILDMLEWTNLNEFKRTTIPR